MKKHVEMANFSVNINKELLKKIEELSKRENRSRNNMIHQLLEMAVKQEKAANGK
jgi:metal-responsive CopG/Arc/MetJ family transcriptional regulator